MDSVPDKALPFEFRLYITRRPNAYQRVIVPKTGYNYELTHEEVDYHCVICRYAQTAPTQYNTPYECPRCKFHYMVKGSTLYVWHPSTVGVPYTVYPPGAQPPQTIVDDGGSNDPEKAEAERKRTQKEFIAKELNKEGDFGKAIQILTPGEKAESPASPSEDGGRSNRAEVSSSRIILPEEDKK